MTFYKTKIIFSFDLDSFSKLNYRPFVAGIIAVIIFNFLSILGYIPQIFATPQTQKVEIKDSVQSKLEQKINVFTLSKKTEIVPAAYAGQAYDNASSYIVFDLDRGSVLAEKESTKKLPIASITKVMSAVVALDLADPNDEFTVTEYAAGIIPTKIGVVPGEKMTLRELLHATLLTSANDAAEVIREGVDTKYGKPVFISAMNEKAKLIGMNNSSFANAQGFDDHQNFSSAADLAILTHYALKEYPLIKEIVAKEYHFLPSDENHKQFDLYNWNGLIGTYPNAYGVKIGNTGRAGVTAMVAATREGTHVGVVLLGTPGVLERDLWTAQLLDVGFESLSGLTPVEVTEEQLRAKYTTWKYW